MPQTLPDIAVVDDDESMCRALKRLLNANGYTVHCYLSAEAVLDDFDAALLRFMVVDVGLPGMTGPELITHLRANRDCTLPVAFISANDDEHTRHEAQCAGCVAFLKKPFSGETLLRALQSY